MPRRSFSADEAITLLWQYASEENRQGMTRFGIDIEKALGVSVRTIRAVAKEIQADHQLAIDLWASGVHEARILASIVDKPEWVTPDQIKLWVGDFNSWDLCDQTCGNLFDKVKGIENFIFKWKSDEREFVKRAAFATIAWQAVHLKKKPDDDFLTYLPLIKQASDDQRNFVKKAVNWALRQIGKRSLALHTPALALAQQLMISENKTAQWIGKDAARELDNEKLKKRLGKLD